MQDFWRGKPAFYTANIGTLGCVESGFLQMPGTSTSMLGICSILKKPVVRDDAIMVRKMMNAVLLWDHRAMVPDVPIEFLNRMKRNLEEPDTYLI